ncbi:MAG: hypothetical protein IJR45_08075 [Firmicutes bacterium]|nr:hypothetical protein [Bacillota bacterium]MBQ9605355.1 hypothetical protein [Bacillota bacterium]
MKKSRKSLIPKIIVIIFILVLIFAAFFGRHIHFISKAEKYLENKYNINITKCTYYNKGRNEYAPPALGIDGGYYYTTPQFGIFETDSGKEIVCVRKLGIYSDDYELENLYSMYYKHLSDELGVDVRFVRFNDFRSGDNRNIGMFLETDTNRYDESTINNFVDNFYNYMKAGGQLEITVCAEENPGLPREKLLDAIEKYKAANQLDGLYVHIYDEDIKVVRPDFLNGTIDDGDMYLMYMDSSQLYSYKYKVICNYTGTRISENEPENK